MPDSAPAKSGRHAAIELRGKPVAHRVYASERLSHDEAVLIPLEIAHHSEMKSPTIPK